MCVLADGFSKLFVGCRKNHTEYCFLGLSIWREHFSTFGGCSTFNTAKLGTWIRNLGTSNECCMYIKSVNLSLSLVSYLSWKKVYLLQVMYVGSSQARAILREYEFYFPRNHKKIKKKKSGQLVSESKQDRIKFDVLLTSYEMINLDTTSLKPIKWECMVTSCDSLCTLLILNVYIFWA